VKSFFECVIIWHISSSAARELWLDSIQYTRYNTGRRCSTTREKKKSRVSTCSLPYTPTVVAYNQHPHSHHSLSQLRDGGQEYLFEWKGSRISQNCGSVMILLHQQHASVSTAILDSIRPHWNEECYGKKKRETDSTDSYARRERIRSASLHPASRERKCSNSSSSCSNHKIERRGKNKGRNWDTIHPSQLFAMGRAWPGRSLSWSPQHAASIVDRTIHSTVQ